MARENRKARKALWSLEVIETNISELLFNVDPNLM